MNHYTIQHDESAGVYELICRPGYGIDGQHYFYEDTRYQALKLAADIRPCDCDDCVRELSEAQQ